MFATSGTTRPRGPCADESESTSRGILDTAVGWLHGYGRIVSLTEDVLDSLLAASRLIGPDQLAPLIALHAEPLGAVHTSVLVVDLQQITLGDLDRSVERVRIEGTIPGRVFTAGEALWSNVENVDTFWCPLLEGLERLGVLGLQVEARSVQFEERARSLAAMVAGLLVSKGPYGDRVVQVRRTADVSVAAEMQWALLPPRSFGTERVEISGTLEPAYDIGGDTFDYALNGDVLHVAVLDAMGRGLPAATLASVAVSAYRQSRRGGLSLEQTAVSMDAVIEEQSDGLAFVTGWLGELDCVSGMLRYVNAGHPLAQLLRDGHVVKALDGPPVLPFGLGHEGHHVSEESLEPGDRLLVYTDGVVEGRRENEGFFGEERLLEYLEHETASGHSAPEILRRLTLAIVDYQYGELADDSSMVLVEWCAELPRAAREELNAAIAETGGSVAGA